MAQIEGRNGLIYELKPLTRKQKVDFSNFAKNNESKELEGIEKLFKKVIEYSYPEISDEEFEDLLDYNCEEYGFAETYELIGYLVEDVFTLEGAKKPNPYLEKKRAEHNNLVAEN